MTKLQILAKVLTDYYEEIKGLPELILDNFENQDENTYKLNGITYHILDEDQVQNLLDEQFEAELLDASSVLEDSGFPNISSILENLNLNFNYLKAYRDADLLKKFIFLGEYNNNYVYEEE